MIVCFFESVLHACTSASTSTLFVTFVLGRRIADGFGSNRCPKLAYVTLPSLHAAVARCT